MYKHELTIPYYMVKYSDNIKLEYLIREFVWASTLDYESYNMDMGNKAWVLMNWDIDIKEMPQYGKKYSFSTEAVGHYRFYAFRDFKVLDGDEVIIYAKSLWTVIDFKERALVSMPEEVKGVMADLDRSHVKDYQFKIPRLESGHIKKIDIENDHIDGNRHVSNAVYLKWFENIFDFDDYIDIEYKRLKLIYKKEILKDENIACKYDFEDGQAFFEIINTDTQELKTSIIAQY